MPTIADERNFAHGVRLNPFLGRTCRHMLVLSDLDVTDQRGRIASITVRCASVFQLALQRGFDDRIEKFDALIAGKECTNWLR